MIRDILNPGLNFGSFIGVLIRLVVVLLAISVHELSHGFAAFKMGDPTAKYDGRLSLNPLKHIDPVGAVCLLLFRFGWAKPVRINPNYFKNLKRGTVVTALAGPISNFIMAYIGVILAVHVFPLFPNIYFDTFLSYFILINLGLGVFNLIPIPPLDGSKIFLSLLPRKIYYEIMRYEQFGFLVLAAALYLGVLSPILNFFNEIILSVLLFLAGGGF